jgi:hypothetical protein
MADYTATTIPEEAEEVVVSGKWFKADLLAVDVDKKK